MRRKTKEREQNKYHRVIQDIFAELKKKKKNLGIWTERIHELKRGNLNYDLAFGQPHFMPEGAEVIYLGYPR